jgi:hypothetical protein
VNSAWHYHSHHELRPGLPCGQQRSPLAAAARSMLCHKAASVVRGLMSKPRAPRTSVHAAPCCGIRTIFWAADQGSVRREPYRSAKKSSRGCRPRASAQPIHEPVMRRGCPTGIESGRNFFARAGINEILPQAQFYVSSKDLVTSKGLTTRMDELGSADAAKSSTREPHICAPRGMSRLIRGRTRPRHPSAALKPGRQL